MGRLAVVNFISIDGVIQSPLSPDEDRDGGFAHGGWVVPYSDDVVDAFMADATVGAAGLLLGRRSYEILTEAWSDADDSEPAIAAMNRMPKYVVSSSADDLPWQNSHPVTGELASAVTALKDRTDGDLVVFGAGALVRGLAEHDLVDEYRLLLFPVVLGAGKRMFDDRGHLARFALTDSVVSPSGVVILTYARDSST
ncbi:dihydrofolate reductase family protein [Georgenia sp. TF02-10]|uniref:dihydrofolate reductase family protein n=1 Tax=Georgenia sp. TF02-10 TaxID=2917725 RepID=UPI001FA74700|nr:dihydrofolate reductase family protein [Georgenia sp. TF02-10]UNX53253.1 dihydrofolate reductase family protein [Georgenia sp. TF02-10]